MLRLRPRPRLLLALLSGLAACGAESTPSGPAAPSALRPVVAAASGPAALVAAAAGAEAVELVAPLGAEMATWRPDDASLDAMVTARSVVVVGDGFEPWLQRAGLPPSRTVRLEAAIPDERWIEVGTFTHTHGGGEAHEHGGRVEAVWTDPEALRSMHALALSRLGGEGDGAPGFEARVRAYEAQLRALSEALDGRALIATGHGLEYLCRAAGITLEVTALELDGAGDTPNSLAVRDLEALAGRRERHAGVLVWPGRLDEPFAGKVQATLGLRSVDFDLGGALAERDTLERLTESAARLRAAVASSEDPTAGPKDR